MKVLIYENLTKTERVVKELSVQDVLEQLSVDNGLIEAISTHDSRVIVRLFFDIDQYDMTTDPLEKALTILCKFFKCSIDEWAIASSNRDDKYSYHIVSRTLCCSLKSLRKITETLHEVSNIFDPRMLYCSITDVDECIYFRLQNQSKKSIHKSSPPLQILNGTIMDFIISDVGKLHIIKL